MRRLRRSAVGFLCALVSLGYLPATSSSTATAWAQSAPVVTARLATVAHGDAVSSSMGDLLQRYLMDYSDHSVRGPGPALPADSPSHAALSIPADSLTAVVKQYCVVCHNDVMLTGNLTLTDFEVERAAQMPERAEKMIVKLRAGMMPLPGAPRPGPDTLLALVETLETLIDEAAANDPNPGSRPFQRLNRAEYASSIHDLLDLDIDAGDYLPLDTKSANFDKTCRCCRRR